MIFSTYVSRMEAANMKLNAYIKTAAREILAFSKSISDFLNPHPIVMSRKDFRKVLSGTGLEKYEITERLFPKKKKRGSMRRARRDRGITNFISTMPENVYIDEWETAHALDTQDVRVGYHRTTNQIFDDFDPPMIPPVSREEFMQKASFSAPWPGPFEGEEEP